MVKVQDIKRQLEARLQALGARIEDITDELRALNSPDFEEQATEGEGDEVLEGLENSALLEIQEIRAALERIAEGSYGECVTCGEAISEKRLEIIPHASECIDCASRSSRPTR